MKKENQSSLCVMVSMETGMGSICSSQLGGQDELYRRSEIYENAEMRSVNHPGKYLRDIHAWSVRWKNQSIISLQMFLPSHGNHDISGWQHATMTRRWTFESESLGFTHLCPYLQVDKCRQSINSCASVEVVIQWIDEHMQK